jgi:hypothetical protein
MEPVREVPDPVTLAARVERIAPIIKAMGARALEYPDQRLCEIAASPEFHRQLDMLAELTNEQLAMFLDILEAGVPEEFKDRLR